MHDVRLGSIFGKVGVRDLSRPTRPFGAPPSTTWVQKGAE